MPPILAGCAPPPALPRGGGTDDLRAFPHSKYTRPAAGFRLGKNSPVGGGRGGGGGKSNCSDFPSDFMV